MDNLENGVEALLNKAAAAEKSDDAMKFAQAALNAANAVCSLKTSRGIGAELPWPTSFDVTGQPIRK